MQSNRYPSDGSNSVENPFRALINTDLTSSADKNFTSRMSSSNHSNFRNSTDKNLHFQSNFKDEYEANQQSAGFDIPLHNRILNGIYNHFPINKHASNARTSSIQLENAVGEISRYFKVRTANVENNNSVIKTTDQNKFGDSSTTTHQVSNVVVENQDPKIKRYGMQPRTVDTNKVADKQLGPNENKNKKNDVDKSRLFTGNVERIIKWNRIYNGFCYFEVIASVVSIQEGTIRLQKTILLRDKKGPILQVVHYVNDYININDFFVGQMLRCIGHMVGPNILHAVSIRVASADEVATLQRLCYICDHAIARAATYN